MRRRKVITLLGAAVAFGPIASAAQQAKVPTIGVLALSAQVRRASGRCFRMTCAI